MKRQILFALTLVCAAGLFLFSCSNLIDAGSEKSVSNGSGTLSLSLGLASPDGAESADKNARTVMALSEYNGISSLTEITLYSKLSSEQEYSELCTWNSAAEIQKSPYSKEIASGTYDFKLTAKNYGATMEQVLASKTVSSGSSTSLEFTSLAPSADGEQTGGISVSAYYRNYSGSSQVSEALKDFVSSSSPYPTWSVKLDSGESLTKPSDAYGKTCEGSDKSSCEFNGLGYSTFTNSKVAAGNHLLTYTFTSSSGDVFVYPVAVQVKAGYLSSATIYPLMSSSSAAIGSTSYTVTYSENQGENSKTAAQTFSGNATVADAESLGFASSSDSARFKYWTKTQNGDGEKYYSGDTLTLDADTTLYAQWGTFYKVSYFINLDGETSSYVQQFESGNSLVESSTAFPGLDSSKYTFCGWDTQADGSGNRYAENAAPSISEDTVLYAQWCGVKSQKAVAGATDEYYTVKDASQWNALMGSPFANTASGAISVNAYISGNITNPARSLTSSKSFSGKIYGGGYTISGLSGVLFDTVDSGAEIKTVTVKGPVCNTNKGTVSYVTVSGIKITGSGDYAGAICGKNEGTLENCTVSGCKVDGSANNVKYTGGLCGYNSGNISGTSTKVAGTVTGSTDDGTFAGGYCAYNTGTISDKGSVNITLSASSGTNSHYGYVIGYNNGGTVSTDITAQETRQYNEQEYTVEKKSITAYTFELTRTAVLTLSVTDNEGGGAIYGNISKTKLSETGDVVTDKVNEATKTVSSSAYLTKGTYYVNLRNENVLSSSIGTFTLTIK